MYNEYVNVYIYVLSEESLYRELMKFIKLNFWNLQNLNLNYVFKNVFLVSFLKTFFFVCEETSCLEFK